LKRGPSASFACSGFAIVWVKTSGLPARSLTGWPVLKLYCWPMSYMPRRASFAANCWYVSAIVAKPFHGLGESWL
jgi:hypothetical protein